MKARPMHRGGVGQHVYRSLDVASLRQREKANNSANAMFPAIA